MVLKYRQAVSYALSDFQTNCLVGVGAALFAVICVLLALKIAAYKKTTKLEKVTRSAHKMAAYSFVQLATQ